MSLFWIKREHSTEGRSPATGWLCKKGRGQQEPHFKDVLLAAEMKSEHPLAGAIVSALQEKEERMETFATINPLKALREKESKPRMRDILTR